MKFNVHSYLILRVQHQGIEAASPQEAIQKASDLLGAADPRFNAGDFGDQAADVELTSEVESFLVDPLDEQGNVIYAQSTSYHADGITPHKPEGIVHAM